MNRKFLFLFDITTNLQGHCTPSFVQKRTILHNKAQDMQITLTTPNATVTYSRLFSSPYLY